MNNLINKIGIDKIAHFSIGFVISISFTLITLIQDGNYSCAYWLAWPIVGIIATAIVAGIKEFIDDKGEVKDFIASAIGAISVYIPILIGLLFNYLS